MNMQNSVTKLRSVLAFYDNDNLCLLCLFNFIQNEWLQFNVFWAQLPRNVVLKTILKSETVETPTSLSLSLSNFLFVEWIIIFHFKSILEEALLQSFLLDSYENSFMLIMLI